MDWGQLAAIGSTIIMAAAVVYGFGRLNGKFDTHATETMRRFDTQDVALTGLRADMQQTRELVANTRGQLGMNGH